MDNVSPKKRSQIMACVRSSGNRSTELRLAQLFRKLKVVGWRRNFQVEGRPDFVFPMQRVAVFVDGCFWHKCPICYRQPKSRRLYWVNKIQRNYKRDKRVNKLLRAMGWAVIRIWECQLKENSTTQLARVVRAISSQKTSQTA
jgi:DNA mismatch endonuclease, patch repair protein